MRSHRPRCVRRLEYRAPSPAGTPRRHRPVIPWRASWKDRRGSTKPVVSKMKTRCPSTACLGALFCSLNAFKHSKALMGYPLFPLIPH